MAGVTTAGAPGAKYASGIWTTLGGETDPMAGTSADATHQAEASDLPDGAARSSLGTALQRIGALGAVLGRSAAPTYAAVSVIVAGFAILAFTWSRVAGTVSVPLQLPYIASGGFTGLALVMLGVVGIHLDAKRRDARQRDRRLDDLASTLDALARALDDTGGDERR